VSDAPQFPEAKPGQQTPYDEMQQFFAYEHLPAHLQEISKPFGDLANWMLRTLPLNVQRTAALVKLLEAKDCAVRAQLFKS
jgi:hypothetical protein